MSVRRRYGTRPMAGLPVIAEDNVENIIEGNAALFNNGKRLFEKAAETGFKEVDKLSQGLECFVEAAGGGSREAAEELQRFLVDTSQKRLAFLLDDLPRDLISSAKVLVEGKDSERQVFQVAKDMFRRMARGEKKEIKKEEIDEAAARLLSTEPGSPVGECKVSSGLEGSVKRLLKYGLKNNGDGEETVTEQAFCLVACQYARGELVLPLDSSDDYQLSSERYKEFVKANWIKKVTEFPKQTSLYFGQFILKSVEKHGVKWVWSYLPTRQLYLMVLVYLIPLLSVSIVVSTLASVVFCLAFVTMILSTLQIVANWRKIGWFMEYSTIFRHFSPHNQTMDTKGPETMLFKKVTTPYASFCISTLLSVLTISLAYQVVMMYELLFILATVMTVFVFVRFNCWSSPIILCSAAFRLLGWSLVMLSMLQRFFPIPEFLFLYGQQIFSVPLLPGAISLEVNLITLVQVPTQLLLLCYLAIRHPLKDTLMAISSYVMFMSWWIFSKQLFTHCSPLYLILFIPAVLMLFFLTPLIPVAFLSAPFVCLFYYGMSVEFLVCACTVVVLGATCLLIVLNYGRLKEARWLNMRIEYMFLLQLLICIPVMYTGAWHYANVYSPTKLPAVMVDQYIEYCTPPGSDNSIQSQINCLHLEGRTLTGHAVVDSVTITTHSNSYVELIKKFPAPVDMALACFIGETTPSCGGISDSPTCQFKGCHLDSYNRYTVTIKASSNNSHLPLKLYTIIPHDRISNCPLNVLKQGTTIQFNGTIVSGMGTSDALGINVKTITFNTSNNTLTQEYSSTNGLHDFSKDGHQAVTGVVHSVKHTIKFVLETLTGYSTTKTL